MAHPDPASLRMLLEPFGPLRAQAAAEWTGGFTLPPSLARFYAEVGPYGDPDERALILPVPGNEFCLPRLTALWDMQAGYRWHGLTGERLEGWNDAWLVVADQGGDPFILDRGSGMILHARHGEGEWNADELFADVFVMAAALGTLAAAHVEAGEGLYDDDFNVQPQWAATVRERLEPLLGEAAADAVAERFGW